MAKRAKTTEPGNPVKEMAGAFGNIPANQFPEINDDITKELQDGGIGTAETGAFEILPGMTVEEMRYMFFDSSALIEPKYKVWQLNSKGHRYYYRFNESNEPEFYPSVTTILSQTLPKSEYLLKWIAEKGYEEAERYKGERAAYGTFMHAQFEELLIARTYNLDGLKERLKSYIEYQHLPSDFINYADDLKKDVLAFAQFIIDYNVRPLAVEIALVHPYLNYAGMIDLSCIMWDKKGGGNDIAAIVDFKSGRKNFYEEHELQGGMYRDMWNANFEYLPIERIYNFSPKDWRKAPSYNLKDQTNSPNLKKIPYLLELAMIEDEKLDNVFISVNGVISLDEKPTLTDNIISLTLSELIQTKATKRDAPDEITSVTVEDLKEQPENEPKPTKRTETSLRAEKPANEAKTAKKTAKKNLLNDEPEI